ncbi:hypothetical protein CROQUDRAFT_110947 [Cronartium quercuum f. sp. fusiforme G11]|uniref:Uncharacterized protein n=1 Tax=Cronartium quercuum f. sp. fusiforme G11 TaxID=708437 RepID=A0A9P6NBE4_9BASI|nr:hypothetical protein CROQUDRAFT_110947 [Cronartium quercuum f. sp. fusiforme G11]
MVNASDKHISSSTVIGPLNKQLYPTWRIRTQIILEASDLLEIANGLEQLPDETSSPEFTAQFLRRDRKAYNLILDQLNDDEIAIINNNPTIQNSSHQLWEHLFKKYGDVKPLEIHQAWANWEACSSDLNDPDLLVNHWKAVSMLTEAGQATDTVQCVTHVLAKILTLPYFKFLKEKYFKGEINISLSTALAHLQLATSIHRYNLPSAVNTIPTTFPDKVHVGSGFPSLEHKTAYRNNLEFSLVATREPSTSNPTMVEDLPIATQATSGSRAFNTAAVSAQITLESSSLQIKAEASSKTSSFRNTTFPSNLCQNSEEKVRLDVDSTKNSSSAEPANNSHQSSPPDGHQHDLNKDRHVITIRSNARLNGLAKISPSQNTATLAKATILSQALKASSRFRDQQVVKPDVSKNLIIPKADETTRIASRSGHGGSYSSFGSSNTVLMASKVREKTVGSSHMVEKPTRELRIPHMYELSQPDVNTDKQYPESFTVVEISKSSGSQVNSSSILQVNPASINSRVNVNVPTKTPLALFSKVEPTTKDGYRYALQLYKPCLLVTYTANLDILEIFYLEYVKRNKPIPKHLSALLRFTHSFEDILSPLKSNQKSIQ